MKFCIIYKYQTTKDKSQLGKELEQLSSLISDLGDNETFIFDRDVKNWSDVDIPREESSKMMFSRIKQSDGVIAYVSHNEPSEGMAMESGYAKALGKKIILACKKGSSALRVRSICDAYIEFEDMEDLKIQMSDYLKSAFAVSQ
ncbi:MAG: nucleoside 2-deoxyribosyltransferase [Patescibacteria group bacterium]|nr:nucleoside 2-deoxyribosyltransferase [Patescibacteria group bacterium]MBU1952884.1 nucleoside 2-deoxyribosyltransferase [Patescibacteria group bacterium]